MLGIALLGALVLTALWLVRPLDGAQAPARSALPIAAAPREQAEAPILPVAAVPPAVLPAAPRDIVAPEPPRPTAQAPMLATPGHASLEIVLLDERGRDASLSYVDSLWLTKRDQQPGEPHGWQFAPDTHGHITTADLPPGRYAGTLHTGLAGVVQRTDLVVTADQKLRAEFRHMGPPLEQRIAVRILGLGPSRTDRARQTDVVLHGPGGSRHIPWDAGGNVFLFDGLAAGRYDLELRRDGKESRWLHGLAPGKLREEWLDLGCEETSDQYDHGVFSGH